MNAFKLLVVNTFNEPGNPRFEMNSNVVSFDRKSDAQDAYYALRGQDHQNSIYINVFRMYGG